MDSKDREARKEEKLAKMQALYAKWGECERCGLCNPAGRARGPIAFGQGNVDASIVIIADAPTSMSSSSSSPLGDAQGEIVDIYLDSLKSSADDVFITTLAACRATTTDDPTKSRPLAAQEIAACMPRLTGILEIVDPFVVLLLGGATLKALSPQKGGISKAAKNPFIPNVEAHTQGRYAKVRRTAFATWSPKYLAMNWDMNQGGPVRQAFDTWQKAFAVADMAAFIYRGDEVPNREDSEDDTE